MIRDNRRDFIVLLDGFEGPIDLLLSLVRDHRLDLTQLPILPLAEQYLAFIRRAQDLDIDLAADYLVMAAVLAYLKSRLLLPDPQSAADDEALNLADALKWQLLRLEAMQKSARNLMALPQLGRERFANGTAEALIPQVTVEMRATLFDLLDAYGSMVQAQTATTLTIAPSQLFSVEEAVTRLAALMQNLPSGWHDFANFLPDGVSMGIDRHSAVAAHFAASLELVRDGGVKLRQDEAFGRLWLARRQRPVKQAVTATLTATEARQ